MNIKDQITPIRLDVTMNEGLFLVDIEGGVTTHIFSYETRELIYMGNKLEDIITAELFADIEHRIENDIDVENHDA